MDLIAEMTAVVRETSQLLKTNYLSIESRVVMFDGDVETKFHAYAAEIGSWDDPTLAGLKEKLVGFEAKKKMRDKVAQLRHEAEVLEAKL